MSFPDAEFYKLVGAAGYGTPRSLPRKTEAKLRKLIRLVRAEAVAAPRPRAPIVCRRVDALIRRSLADVDNDNQIEATGRPVDQQSYYRRLEAAADQLHALATARTEAYRQVQLVSIDWKLVADEFASAAGRYARSVERYASRAIANIASKLITYRDSMDLLRAMSDLEAHIVDFDPAEVDDDIAHAWENSVDEMDIARGIVRNIEPIRTLEELRAASGEKLATHRKLGQNSTAYHSGWSVLYTDQAIADLLRAEAMPMMETLDALLTGVGSEWKRTSLVLARVALTLNMTACDAVLAELSRAIWVAVEEGSIEARGDTELWEYSELRRGLGGGCCTTLTLAR